MFQKHPGSMSMAMIGGCIVGILLRNIIIGFLAFFILFALFSTWSEKQKK